jgi:hypothetical protein
VTLPPPVEADAYATAVEAHRANNAAGALRLLLAAEPTPEALRLLVEVALDVGTLEAAREAIRAVAACDAAVRERAFMRRAARALWEELQESAGPAGEAPTPENVPSGWAAWLERAVAGPWPAAAAVAEKGASEWPPAPDPSAFAARLAAATAPHALAAVRDSLPHLLRAFLPGGRPEAAFKPVYRQLLELTVLDDDLSPGAADAVRELADAVLRSNPVATKRQNDYAEVVESLGVAWDRLKRPALLDWGLDQLDVLASHAAHRHADVTPLLQDVVAEFALAARRVSGGQRQVLGWLCGELGRPELIAMAGAPPVMPGAPSPEQEAAAFRRRLAGKSVVLLTMSDRIASSFRGVMRVRYPEARVDVLQEEDESKRLKSNAQNADVFIVNTWDVPHMASGPVQKHRPAGAVTLYPKGKNAARQLDALEEWLRSS